MKQVMKAYQGKVRLVIKNSPSMYHEYADSAAEASLAARDQGKYWEMHDRLLNRSPKLDHETLMSIARELGLNIVKFSESINAERHEPEIAQDKKLAVEMKISGTPTFFINGRKLVGEQPFSSFKEIIDQELNGSN